MFSCKKAILSNHFTKDSVNKLKEVLNVMNNSLQDIQNTEIYQINNNLDKSNVIPIQQNCKELIDILSKK